MVNEVLKTTVSLALDAVEAVVLSVLEALLVLASRIIGLGLAAMIPLALLETHVYGETYGR